MSSTICGGNTRGSTIGATNHAASIRSVLEQSRLTRPGYCESPMQLLLYYIVQTRCPGLASPIVAWHALLQCRHAVGCALHWVILSSMRNPTCRVGPVGETSVLWCCNRGRLSIPQRPARQEHHTEAGAAPTTGIKHHRDAFPPGALVVHVGTRQCSKLVCILLGIDHTQSRFPLAAGCCAMRKWVGEQWPPHLVLAGGVVSGSSRATQILQNTHSHSHINT